MFTFVKCVNEKFSSLKYGYMLRIGSMDELMGWWDVEHGDSTRKCWQDFRENVRIKDGHAWGHPANPIGSYSLAFAQIRGTSFVDEVGDLQAKRLEGMLKTLRRHGRIYVQRLGSYTPGVREVGKPVVSEVMEFPAVPAYTKADIKIVKWPGGNHFYGEVGGHEIPGRKRPTCESAQEECDKLLRKLNRKARTGR